MSIAGAGRFSELVNDFAKQAPKIAVQVTNKAVLELFTKIVMDTPVDTGRARGNWQVSIGQGISEPTTAEDKDGGSTISKATGTMTGDKSTAAIFIQNNLPYIKKLEYGHWSRKAPNGMLRKNIALMNQYLTKAIAELKGGK